LQVRQRLFDRIERLILDSIRRGMKLPHLILVETPGDARIEAAGERRTTMRMSRNEHQVSFLKPVAFAHCLHDFAMLTASEDVHIRTYQNPAVSLLVLKSENAGPEVGGDAFRGPVSMPISSQPSELIRGDLSLSRSRPELLREPTLEPAQPDKEDHELNPASQCRNCGHAAGLLGLVCHSIDLL
jgi:hypothetical protein